MFGNVKPRPFRSRSCWLPRRSHSLILPVLTVGSWSSTARNDIQLFHSLSPKLFPRPRASYKKTSYADYWAAIEQRQESRTTTAHKNIIPINWQKMKCYIQFLTTPTADTPGTTLVLHFDNKRYLIGNIAEGTQRAAVQRKLGLLKVRNVFLTGTVSWATTGGIMGMILTLADSLATSRNTQITKSKGREGETAEEEKISLDFHGGKNLTHLIATARRFIFRQGVPINVNEFRAEIEGQKSSVDVPSWEDGNVKVWVMTVEPEGSRQVGAQHRKRSHDEYEGEGAFASSGKEENDEEREVRFDKIRKSVVSSMFDSDWKLDALFKKRLADVRKDDGVVFFRNDHGHIEEYKGPMIYEDPSTPDREVLMRNPWPGAKVETLPPTTPSTSSTSYIFKTHRQRGKFDVAKARELKVPKGPAYRKLTQGETVIAEDGTTITPEMVLGEGFDGNGVAVIELPSAAYVGPLLAREEWSSSEITNTLKAIVWILGDGLLEDPRIQAFMKARPQTQHYVSSKDCCPNSLALESAASSAIRLHLLDSERFPIPNFNNEVPTPQGAEVPFQAARSGLMMNLLPKFDIDNSGVVPYLDTEQVVKEASQTVQELAEVGRKEIVSEEYLELLARNQEDIPSKDAEVITLGTGSALPSKYRNVSATLVRVPGYGSYLLDCGENTLGQLSRVFGDELPEVLRDLKAIWISHLHADHHLGTASVIRAWSRETAKHDETKQNRLLVASHEGMLSWLKEYSEIEDFGHSRVQPISLGGETTFNWYFKEGNATTFGLSSIHACYVQHCKGAMAVIFKFPNGFSVAYSGDCRPSDYFAKIAKGATLLIHEATFDDELLGDAKAKKHSTTSEALHVGKMMGARRILLTHFSQRYQKLPVMDSHGGKDQVAIVAFDYMRVKIGDFAKLEAFKPALLELFKEEDSVTEV